MEYDFSGIMVQMVILFAIIAIGYIAKKAKIMDNVADKKLSTIILNTSLPAMVLASVLNADNVPSADQLVSTIVISIASYAVIVGLAYLVTKVLRISIGHQGAFRFMMTFGNVGFIGYPVLSAIFGPQAIVFASIFNMAFNFLCFTLGVYWISQDNELGVKVKMSPKTFLTPVIFACAITLALAFLGVHSVPVLGPACQTLGNMTTPAALLVIGSSLANMPVKELLGGPRLFVVSAFRLAITPLIIWGIFHFFVSDPLVLGVLVVISGMPVATNGTMLCHQYNGNTHDLAQGTFVTTVLSMATIPLLVLLLA